MSLPLPRLESEGFFSLSGQPLVGEEAERSVDLGLNDLADGSVVHLEPFCGEHFQQNMLLGGDDAQEVCGNLIVHRGGA